MLSILISSFHFLFCLFGSSLFSSWWAWLKVYQFYLFKDPGLVSLIFSGFFFFFVSILFISHLIFMIFIISFFLLTLGFILFIILLDGRLGYLFKIFIVSWGRPLELLLLHCIDFGKLCFHIHLSWNFSDFLFDFFIDALVFFSSSSFSFPLFLYNWLPVSYYVWKKRLDVSSLLLSLFWPRGQQKDRKDWCRHSAWLGCRLWWSGHRQRLVVLLTCCLSKHQ